VAAGAETQANATAWVQARPNDRLDDAEGSIDAVDSLLDEAALAFELNIDLSAAVQAAVEAA